MKTIACNVAGQNKLVDISVTEDTTAQEVLDAVKCSEYELSPGVGQPPFGKDEKIYNRVKDGGKVIASPKADAGYGNDSW